MPGLSTNSFTTIERVAEGKKLHFWEWRADSDDDLRYKGPTAGAPGAAAPHAASPLKSGATPAWSSVDEWLESSPRGRTVGGLVAFVSSPLGSATFWPTPRPRGPQPQGLWRHSVSEDAGVLTPRRPGTAHREMSRERRASPARRRALTMTFTLPPPSPRGGLAFPPPTPRRGPAPSSARAPGAEKRAAAAAGGVAVCVGRTREYIMKKVQEGSWSLSREGAILDPLWKD